MKKFLFFTLIAVIPALGQELSQWSKNPNFPHKTGSFTSIFMGARNLKTPLSFNITPIEQIQKVKTWNVPKIQLGQYEEIAKNFSQNPPQTDNDIRARMSAQNFPSDNVRSSSQYCFYDFPDQSEDDPETNPWKIYDNWRDLVEEEKLSAENLDMFKSLGAFYKIHLMPKKGEEWKIFFSLLHGAQKYEIIGKNISCAKIINKLDYGMLYHEQQAQRLPVIVIYPKYDPKTKTSFAPILINALNKYFAGIKGSGILPRFNRSFNNSTLIAYAQGDGDDKNNIHPFTYSDDPNAYDNPLPAPMAKGWEQGNDKRWALSSKIFYTPDLVFFNPELTGQENPELSVQDVDLTAKTS